MLHFHYLKLRFSKKQLMRLRIAFRQTAAITHDSIWQGHVFRLGQAGI